MSQAGDGGERAGTPAPFLSALTRDLLDVVPDGLVLLDVTTGRPVYANECGRRHLAGGFAGLPAAEADVPRVREAVTAVASGRTLEEVVRTTVCGPGGEPLPLELRITPRHRVEATDLAQLIVLCHDLREREAARERLRASEELFRTAFEQAPIGIALAQETPDGRRRIVRANRSLAALLGRSVPDLIGADTSEFSYEEGLAGDDDLIRTAIDGEGRRVTSRRAYRHRDGSVRWAEAHASEVDLPEIDGALILAHIVDVTDRHLAEARRNRRAATAELLAQVVTGVLGRAPLTELYQTLVDGLATALDADDVHLALSDTAGPVHSPPPSSPPTSGERQARVGRRLYGYLDGRGVLVAERAPEAEEFTAADADLLTWAARQLSLAIHLGRARLDSERLAVLEERHRVARDLHDTVIQDLIALGLRLQLTARRGSGPSPEEVEELVHQLDETIRRLRSTVFDLRAVVVTRSVGETVQSLVADAARALGHQPELALAGDLESLPGEIVENLTAVARETLSNVARHARAQRTTVRLARTDDEVTLTVTDDGRGVPVNAMGGQGLANLRERAAELGGRLEVTSPLADGHGTRVRWQVPTSCGTRSTSGALRDNGPPTALG